MVMPDAGWISIMLGRPFKRPSMGLWGWDMATISRRTSISLSMQTVTEGWPLAGRGLDASLRVLNGLFARHQAVFASLTQKGFAVLGFDQIAFGTRVRDARDFYQRYPKWSLLGKMVADTRAAVDAVAALDAGGCIANLPGRVRAGRKGGTHNRGFG